jgi:hypothetical protein
VNVVAGVSVFHCWLCWWIVWRVLEEELTTTTTTTKITNDGGETKVGAEMMTNDLEATITHQVNYFDRSQLAIIKGREGRVKGDERGEHWKCERKGWD